MNACAHTRTVQELKELTKAETVLAKETLSLGECRACAIQEEDGEIAAQVLLDERLSGSEHSALT